MNLLAYAVYWASSICWCAARIAAGAADGGAQHERGVAADDPPGAPRRAAGQWMQRHGAAIRGIQWVVVAVYAFSDSRAGGDAAAGRHRAFVE
jgi:hypothetical protein